MDEFERPLPEMGECLYCKKPTAGKLCRDCLLTEYPQDSVADMGDYDVRLELVQLCTRFEAALHEIERLKKYEQLAKENRCEHDGHGPTSVVHRAYHAGVVAKLENERRMLVAQNDCMALKLEQIVVACGFAPPNSLLGQIKDIAMGDGLTPDKIEDVFGQLLDIFGWKGGTIHQALAEVRRLRDQDRGAQDLRKESLEWAAQQINEKALSYPKRGE